MKVMIVDDSTMVRNAVERVLRLRGSYIVCHARNGAEAVRVFEQERPEFVTMDITMPQMDGVECVQKLLKLDPTVKILVISSLEDAVTGVEVIKRGAKGFLCKPFSSDELLAAIDEVLNYRKGGEKS